jgi:hypothetical protein
MGGVSTAPSCSTEKRLTGGVMVYHHQLNEGEAALVFLVWFSARVEGCVVYQFMLATSEPACSPSGRRACSVCHCSGSGSWPQVVINRRLPRPPSRPAETRCIMMRYSAPPPPLRTRTDPPGLPRRDPFISLP